MFSHVAAHIIRQQKQHNKHNYLMYIVLSRLIGFVQVLFNKGLIKCMQIIHLCVKLIIETCLLNCFKKLVSTIIICKQAKKKKTKNKQHKIQSTHPYTKDQYFHKPHSLDSLLSNVIYAMNGFRD